VAGDKLNEDIINFAQEEYKLLIGERTAEMIKIGIGSAYPQKEKRQMPMRGRNLVTGLPEEISVTDEDIRGALEKSVKQIVAEVKTAVEETPPELLADIMATGIQLSGGGSLLRGLDTLIQKETKIITRRIEDPMTAVVRGAGMVLEDLDGLQEVLAETEYLEPPR
jgi:rod shape-determining protein MreB